MTNFDKMKSMTIDEMTEFLYCGDNCAFVECNECLINKIDKKRSYCRLGNNKKDYKQWLLNECEE